MKTITDPITKDMLVEGLKKMGVAANQILEVHSSLSAFDYVIGGARSVVDALMEVVGENGTLLMPMHANDNSEPSDWVNPAIAPELYKDMRKAIPAYDANVTDTPHMGAVVENFKHRDGVVISNHPNVSYAAWGRYAKLLCNRQSLHFPLAEESPCARLYELKGNVLLLGVDFDTCTCMHLAEYRCDARPIQIHGASVTGEDGNPTWKKYLDLDINSDDFIKVRKIMQRKNMVKSTMLGGCKVMYFSASAAIDETCTYLERTQVYELYR